MNQSTAKSLTHQELATALDVIHTYPTLERVFIRDEACKRFAESATMYDNLEAKIEELEAEIEKHDAI